MVIKLYLMLVIGLATFGGGMALYVGCVPGPSSIRGAGLPGPHPHRPFHSRRGTPRPSSTPSLPFAARDSTAPHLCTVPSIRGAGLPGPSSPHRPFHSRRGTRPPLSASHLSPPFHSRRGTDGGSAASSGSSRSPNDFICLVPAGVLCVALPVFYQVRPLYYYYYHYPPHPHQHPPQQPQHMD